MLTNGNVVIIYKTTCPISITPSCLSLAFTRTYISNTIKVNINEIYLNLLIVLKICCHYSPKIRYDIIIKLCLTRSIFIQFLKSILYFIVFRSK